MKVGIQTIHASYNVGAMLQAYATAKAVEKLGHEPAIIDYYPRQEEQKNTFCGFPDTPKKLLHALEHRLRPAARRRLKNFLRLRMQMPLTRRYYTYEELQQEPPDFDVYLSGSDQIWNIADGFVPAFFLQYLPSGKRKVSYASSFGRETFSAEEMARLGVLLKDYQQIGVRETSGIKIVRDACGKAAALNLDPTFLLSGEEWSDLANQADKHSIIDRPYWYLSQLEYTTDSEQIVAKLTKQLQIRGVEYSTKIHNPRKQVDTLYDAGPLEMINLIRNADFILTSSFHTMAFAIHFRKPFFVILRNNNRNRRMSDLLEQLDLSDHIGVFPEQLSPIDYAAVEAKIATLVNASKNYLASILKEATT